MKVFGETEKSIFNSSVNCIVRYIQINIKCTLGVRVLLILYGGDGHRANRKPRLRPSTGRCSPTVQTCVLTRRRPKGNILNGDERSTAFRCVTGAYNYYFYFFFVCFKNALEISRPFVPCCSGNDRFGVVVTRVGTVSSAPGRFIFQDITVPGKRNRLGNRALLRRRVVLGPAKSNFLGNRVSPAYAPTI